MNSRRQRYFRARSPSGREMDVLEPADLVMEGDPSDEQRVSHEEIVDDGSSEMTIEHHQMRQQPPPQLHYEERQYTVPPAPPRRPGRPGNRYTTQTMPMDVIQKLQSKSVYMSRQAQQLGGGGPQTRISPGGARIVSLPTASRKREMDSGPGMMLKRMGPPQHHIHQQPHHQQTQNQQYAMRNIPMQRIEHPKEQRAVKVVRLVPNSSRPTPQMAEQAILDLDERIKQTIEDSKCDLDKVKELQEQGLSQDEYGQMLGWLLGEMDRLNAANTSLNEFYRQKQRHEKTIYEAREDMFSARIRQLEQENRKLREGMLVMYNARFESYDHSMMRHEEVHEHEEHMGPIMEGETEHVVIEHENKQEEVPPEWIVEETVDDIHMHPEQVQVVHQEISESHNNKPKLEGVEQFEQNQ